MKKFIASIVIATLFWSCETEPIDPAILDNVTQEQFQVQIDGQQFTSSNATAVIADGQISILAPSDNSQEQITLNLSAITPGTYTGQLLATYQTTPTATPFYNLNLTPNGPEVTGSITIFSINQNTGMISGTFQFVGYYDDTDTPGESFQPKTFSSGMFNIPFTTEPTPIPTGSFSAKIDGALFTATNISASLDDYSTLPGQPADIKFSMAGNTGQQSIALFFNASSSSFDFPLFFPDAMIQYVPLLTNPTVIYSSINPENPESVVGNLTITNRNNDNNTISGTFQIKVFQIDMTGNVLGSVNITEGQFTNIPFTDNTN